MVAWLRSLRSARAAVTTRGSAATRRDGTLPAPATPGVSGGDGAGGGSAGGGAAARPSGGVGTSGDGGADGGVTGPWPGSNLVILPFAVQKQASGAGWGDGAHRHRHVTCPTTYGTQYDVPDDFVAWGDVGTLGIDSYLRIYQNVTGQRANGFYLMKDRFALVVEPPTTRVTSVAPYVPASLRGSRFQSYLVDQATTWDDTPTFILDQWNCETNGSEVAVELAKAGSFPAPTRRRVGRARIHRVLAGARPRGRDPRRDVTLQPTRNFANSWRGKPERAMGLYRAGAVLPSLAAATQDAYYAAWKTSADGKALRNFARRTWSAAYVTKVFEIAAATE